MDTGPVKDVVVTGDDAEVTRIAGITHSDGDAGAYISSGAVIATGPDTGAYNGAGTTRRRDLK